MKLNLTFALLLCCFFTGAQILPGKTILKEEGIQNAYPRLSNDNTKILYQSNRTGKWQLFILDLKTGKSQRLTNDTSNTNFPDWSNDNKWIAFVSDRNGNEEIYLMKTDGTGLKRLTDHKSRDIHPYFSPDGKYLLFNSDRGNGSLDIYRLELASSKIERLTDTKENETCARYSPDMKQMVFLRNDDLSDDVFIMNMTNGLAENLTKTPGTTDGWPMFSPDSKQVYFSSLESGIHCIYKIDANGKNKKQVTHAGKKEEDARVFISKDGKMMIFNKKQGTTISIYAVYL
jgi:TolB protein